MTEDEDGSDEEEEEEDDDDVSSTGVIDARSVALSGASSTEERRMRFSDCTSSLQNSKSFSSLAMMSANSAKTC